MISPELLRGYPYFAGISEESLKAIAMMAEERNLPAGTLLFNEGDRADRLSVIVKGEVDIQYLLGNGEYRTVDTLVDGDLLCWSALIEPHKTTAVGTTRKDTRLASIQADKLRALCESDPLVGYRLVTSVAKLLADRLQGARVQLAAV